MSVDNCFSISSRYPFYMLGCFNTEWKDLTWLRYTVWIPLYPWGALAEGKCVHCILNVFPFSQLENNSQQINTAVAVVQSIPLFDEANLFSIDLTKSIGVSIRFSHFLYIYLVLMVLGESGNKPCQVYWTVALCTLTDGPFSALMVNFRHLYKQRKRRFHTKKRKAQWDKAIQNHLCLPNVNSTQD